MRSRTWERIGAAGFCVGMVLYAWFAHAEGLRTLRLGAIGLSSAALAITLASTRRSVRKMLALRGIGGTEGWAWLVGLLVLGAAAGVYYRHARGLAMIPQSLGWFALVAGGIGLAEELAYRGMVQGALGGGNASRTAAWGAVSGAALGHAAYKTALFAGPGVSAATDLLLLGGATFAGGLILGASRTRTGSLFPAASFHVLFDVVAYGSSQCSAYFG